ncbi:glycoside hydrolase family protein [Microbacterium esteraromaticum]|uniref:glycoside hydrolase family protein n=1 Tax=Microbacterium esteraromaticum TaxID=57043 RepID=UPI002368C7C2|nr:glycoside hydrolase family protein [Microbacterium esteraromaticum]WDH78487.1 glycoside hydrolase family protein [Microbacterium esteraromaticum]
MSNDALDLSTALAPVDAVRGVFAVDGYYVWCGTPVAADDGYYLFYSRWPHGSAGRDPDDEGLFDGFDGWLKHSEIAVARASDPHGPYTQLRTILTGSGDPTRWDRFTAHNPHVRRFGNRYYLFYVATNPGNTPEPTLSRQPSSWLRYHSGQRIGVIVADTLEELVSGRAAAPDAPLIAPDGIRTFQMAVNPSVAQTPHGDFVMMYKTWDAEQHYINVIATAPQPDGPYALQGTALQGAQQAEDPYLFFDPNRQRFYAIVKDFQPGDDRTGCLTPQFGALALVESDDARTWRPAEHPVVSLRRLRTTTGDNIDVERLERPQLLFDETGWPIALHAAISVGDPELGTQNVCIPLRPEPVGTHV